MDWVLGILTLVAIVFGELAFRDAAMNRASKSTSQPPKPDYRAAIAKQAREAEKRSLQIHPGLSWDEWLHAAAMRLQSHWPSISYDEARDIIRDYMTDIATHPDPAFDWSLAAAIETADEYMREFGESHGANE